MTFSEESLSLLFFKSSIEKNPWLLFKEKSSVFCGGMGYFCADTGKSQVHGRASWLFPWPQCPDRALLSSACPQYSCKSVPTCCFTCNEQILGPKGKLRDEVSLKHRWLTPSSCSGLLISSPQLTGIPWIQGSHSIYTIRTWSIRSPADVYKRTNAGSVLRPSANYKMAFGPYGQQRAVSLNTVVVSLEQEFLSLISGPVMDPERAFKGSHRPL